MSLRLMTKYTFLLIFCLATGGAIVGCNPDAEDNQSTTPMTCGNGELDDGEVCDGGRLGEATCESQGLYSGKLSCSANCLELDTSDCLTCQPKTCAELGGQCGSVDDGCGGTVECGCSGELSCGGGGTPDVCGATCAAGCPDGFTCNNEGVCTGASDPIIVNMPAVTVTLGATVNGRSPRPDSNCTSGENGLAKIGFQSLRPRFHRDRRGEIFEESGDYRAYPLPCDGSPLQVMIPQDTYDVTVMGYHSTDMPAPIWPYPVQDTLEIDTDMDIDADMPTAAVTLPAYAKVNGEIPPDNGCVLPDDATGLEGNASIRLTSLTTGSTRSYDLSCDGSAETIVLPQDTYSVLVTNGWGSTPGTYYAYESLEIDDDISLTANMVTGADANIANVTFDTKLDGLTPDPADFGCDSSREHLAKITLNSLTRDFERQFSVLPCDESPAESYEVPKDTYRVSVRFESSSEGTPPQIAYQAHDSFVVDDDMTIAVDVPTAMVTLTPKIDGHILQPVDNCDNGPNVNANPGANNNSGERFYSLATFRLTNLASGYSWSYEMPCADTSKVVRLPLGDYRISIESFHATNGLSDWSFRTHESLAVGTDMTVVADMPTATVSLVAQIDGHAPEPGDECGAGTNTLAKITLRSLTTKYARKYNLPCDGSPREGIRVPKNTYRVTVENNHSADLPDEPYQSHASLVVDDDMAITANIPMVTVNLLAQVNGHAPQPDSTCAPGTNGLTEITMRSLSTDSVHKFDSPCDGGPLEVTIPQDIYNVRIKNARAEEMPDWDSDLGTEEANVGWNYEAIQRIEIR